MYGAAVGETLASPFIKPGITDPFFPAFQSWNYLSDSRDAYLVSHPEAGIHTALTLAVERCLLRDSSLENLREEVRRVISSDASPVPLPAGRESLFFGDGDLVERLSGFVGQAVSVAAAMGPVALWADSESEAKELAAQAVRSLGGTSVTEDSPAMNAAVAAVRAAWFYHHDDFPQKALWEAPQGKSQEESIVSRAINEVHRARTFEEAVRFAAVAGRRGHYEGPEGKEVSEYEFPGVKDEDGPSYVHRPSDVGAVAAVAGMLAEARFGRCEKLEMGTREFLESSALSSLDLFYRAADNRREDLAVQVDVIEVAGPDAERERTADDLSALGGLLADDGTTRYFALHDGAPDALRDYIRKTYGESAQMIPAEKVKDWTESLKSSADEGAAVTIRPMEYSAGRLVERYVPDPVVTKAPAATREGEVTVVSHRGRNVVFAREVTPALEKAARELFGPKAEVWEKADQAEVLRRMKAEHEGYFEEVASGRRTDLTRRTWEMLSEDNKKLYVYRRYDGVEIRNADGKESRLFLDEYYRLPPEQRKAYTLVKPAEPGGTTHLDFARPAVRTMYLVGTRLQMRAPGDTTLSAEAYKEAADRFEHMQLEASVIMNQVKDNLGLNVDSQGNSVKYEDLSEADRERNARLQLYADSAFVLTRNAAAVTLEKGGQNWGSVSRDPRTGALKTKEGEFRGGEYLEGALADKTVFTERDPDVLKVGNEFVLEIGKGHKDLDIELRRKQIEEEESGEKGPGLPSNEELLARDLGRSRDPLITNSGTPEACLLEVERMYSGLSETQGLREQERAAEAGERRPVVYFMSVWNRTMKSIKKYILEHQVDVVCNPCLPYDKSEVCPGFNLAYLKKGLKELTLEDGCPVGYADFYKDAFKQRNEAGLRDGRLDYSLLAATKEFQSAIKRVKNGVIEKGYKSLFLMSGRPEHDMTFATVGRALHDAGFECRYVYSNGEDVDHETVEKRMCASYDRYPTEQGIQDCYASLISERGWCPSTEALAKAREEIPKNEYRRKMDSYESLGVAVCTKKGSTPKML